LRQDVAMDRILKGEDGCLFDEIQDSSNRPNAETWMARPGRSGAGTAERKRCERAAKRRTLSFWVTESKLS